MRNFVASSVITLLVSVGCMGQQSKKSTGPAPPSLNTPGEQHPMPIPREQPVVPPDVRTPKHETGRERPVTADEPSGTAPSTSGRTTPKQTGRAAESSETKRESTDKSKHGSPTKAPAKSDSGSDKR